MQVDGIGGWFNKIPQVSRSARVALPSRPAIASGFSNALRRNAMARPARVRSVYQRAFQARRAALHGVDTTQYMGGLLNDIFSPSVAALKSKVAQITGSDVVKAATTAYTSQQAAKIAASQVATAQAVQAAEEAKMATAYAPAKGGRSSTPLMIAGAGGVGLLLWMMSRRKGRA